MGLQAQGSAQRSHERDCVSATPAARRFKVSLSPLAGRGASKVRCMAGLLPMTSETVLGVDAALQVLDLREIAECPDAAQALAAAGEEGRGGAM
jgi:hypothetical protein